MRPYASLLDRASAPYRAAGRFAYHFARGKLHADPVFRALLETRLLADKEQVLDLGCGQGLLTAWLGAAAANYADDCWPAGWPAPMPRAIRGIEMMAGDVARARNALGPGCGISQGDIRTAEFGAADAVVILDVLHYMNEAEQLEVIRRVRAALPPQGLLLLRVGDAGGGLRFRYSQWVDKIVMLLRGHSLVKTHCRTQAEWRALLNECGFEVQARPMSQGTKFANVLFIGRAV